jgi:hypothetical protein
MAGKRDKQKLQKFMGDIETMKYEGIDHQHPKFLEWKKEVRTTLKGMYGEGSPILSRFDEVGSRRREERMWEEGVDLKGKSKASFKVDLEQARTILEEALEVAQFLGEDGKGIDEAEFINTVSKGGMQEAVLPQGTDQVKTAEPSPPVHEIPAPSPQIPIEMPPHEAVRERKRKKDVRKKEIHELLNELDKEKKDLEKVQTTIQEAMGEVSLRSEQGRIEDLLQQLEEQIKNPDVEMRKVQKTMEELLRVKGKKALLERLTQETKDTTVPWIKIKELMRSVWEIDKKLLIDMLPDLLED